MSNFGESSPIGQIRQNFILPKLPKVLYGILVLIIFCISVIYELLVVVPLWFAACVVHVTAAMFLTSTHTQVSSKIWIPHYIKENYSYDRHGLLLLCTVDQSTLFTGLLTL